MFKRLINSIFGFDNLKDRPEIKTNTNAGEETQIDQLEAAGIVGPNQGSKVRDVMVKNEEELQIYFRDL